jgi:DNA-binding NarL/FixJ family response regulator
MCYYCIYCCTNNYYYNLTNEFTNPNYLKLMEKQQFIILEDCKLLCNGLAEWLTEDNCYKVLMQTGNWTEFKTKVGIKHRTNVISSFQWILKHPGLQEFNDFFKKYPWVNVVCLDDGSPTFSAISLAGSMICGVINLTSNKEEFLWGVKNVVEGNFYISRKTSTIEPGQHENLGSKPAILTTTLSRREEEILNYISLGYTDKEIGELLFLSKRTVYGYKKNLLAKFGAKNAAHLARFATERNYQLTDKTSYN